VKLNLKARYIDSDLTYFTHYANSYSNPANPYLDPDQKLIGLYSDGTYAEMDVFSTDNNVQFDFRTGERIEHVLLAGVDYSWNHVRKTGGFGYEVIDIYDIDYDNLSDWGGGLPPPEYAAEDVAQKQLGFYLQDQIRFYDRVSVVLGVRHDKVTSDNFGAREIDERATSFRAGIIGEIVRGVSPFFSFTESFEPIAGVLANGDPFKPQRGRQFEVGVKFHPSENIIVTLTGYDIEETNRPVSDDSTPDPTDQIQIGSSFSRGFEFEATAILPGDLQLIANYAYNQAEVEGTGVQLDNVPKHNASIWVTKPFALTQEVDLTLGGGLRYAGEGRSYGPAFPDGILTPDYVLADAFAELTWGNWSLAVNATNLFGKDYYSACLARGDCFQGAERNVYGTLGYRF
jgi:iron complex outermembrane receptor protein